ncbi:MAG: hypothetical protein PUB55_00320 [Bacteroidales bacterium]|nr:hypothetical protein [Bacteroidales bacterium]
MRCVSSARRAQVCASIIACNLAIGSGQSATTSGVAFLGGVSVLPACRRHPGRRNTGLRTAATTYRGGGNVRLRSSAPPTAEGERCAAPIGSRHVALEVSVSEPLGALGALGVAR